MSLKRILGSLFVGAVLSQAAQATPTLAEYAASPEYNAVDLSPNGSMLSIIHEIDGQDQGRGGFAVLQEGRTDMARGIDTGDELCQHTQDGPEQPKKE